MALRRSPIRVWREQGNTVSPPGDGWRDSAIASRGALHNGLEASKRSHDWVAIRWWR